MSENDNKEIYDQIAALVADHVEDKSLIRADASLIGENRLLDSMTLVEICLELEDLASDQGFDFDWTSETALSRSNSMFRSLTALAVEFSRQKAEQLRSDSA